MGVFAACMAAFPAPAEAGDLMDACWVRSIEDQGSSLQVSLDVDLVEVENRARAALQSSVPGPNVTLGAFRWKRVDAQTLGLEVDYQALFGGSDLVIKIGGSVSARVVIAIAGPQQVTADLLLDTLVIQNTPVPLKGKVGAGFASTLQVPWSGALARIELVGVELPWLMVLVETTAVPPASPPPPAAGATP